MTIAPLGDSALVVTFGAAIDQSTLTRVRSLTAELHRIESPYIIDVVPAYTTVTVFYEIGPAGMSGESAYERIRNLVTACLSRVEHRWPILIRQGRETITDTDVTSDARRVFEIPVCYGGDFGPDIAEVAQHGGLTIDRVVSLHSRPQYDVQAIGFTPGFPYLAGLAKELNTPRRATPRLSVPAGSVGIGGQQTGVYPLSSPGGWQLIGRTPLELFNVSKNPPAVLQVGDRVKFKAITEQEFESWR
jgi:inhibitor of KinA